MKARFDTLPMGKLCSISSGESDTQDAVADGPYAFFDRSKTIKRSSRYLYNCEALIIPGEGKEFLPKHFEGKFDLHQRAYALFGFSPSLDVRFLFHFLHHRSDYFPRVAVGATVKSLRRRHFEDLPVPVPPLPEQRRIVGILDEAFEGIATVKANAEQNGRNARAIFKSHLQSVFAQCGPGWMETTIGALYKVGSSKRVLKSEWKSEGVPFYRGREITRLSVEGYVDNELFISEERFAQLSQAHGVPRAGDIVITAIGTIGNAHIVRDSDRFYFKDASVLWMKRTSAVCSEFIKFWLRSPQFCGQLERGNGATVDTLTIQKLQNVAVRMPDLSAQERLVAELGALEVKSQQLARGFEQKIATLNALRRSLLHQAFSGEL